LCTVLCIAENLLRHNDPELCDFLEAQFIQSQLYGMRWARLMLGREFSITDSQVLRIWDYIFASCIHLPQPAVDVLDPLSMDLLGVAGCSDNSVVAASRSRYGPNNPMLTMLGNFMLAMLLHVRSEMIEGDASTALTLLMHYPVMDDITPIVEYADMIRRGVLDPGAHVGKLLGGGMALSLQDNEAYSSLGGSGSRGKEFKVRLKEAATPMLSMGRRVSKLVTGSPTHAGGALGGGPLGGPEPQENLSRTHNLFSSLTRNSSSSNSSSSSSSNTKSPTHKEHSSMDILALTESTSASSVSKNNSIKKSSLFTSTANKV
jgi:hypothetical protein